MATIAEIKGIPRKVQITPPNKHLLDHLYCPGPNLTGCFSCSNREHILVFFEYAWLPVTSPFQYKTVSFGYRFTALR